MLLKTWTLFFGIFFSFNAFTATSVAPILVGYYSADSKKNFEEKIKPLFEKQTKGCAKCQIVDLTPYDEKGQFKMAGLEDSLKQLPKEIKILFFDFNLKKGEVSSAVIESLSQLSAQGVLVVASAGMPHDQQPSSPLSRTLFGQVKDAIIIGELSERDRLIPQSFFGPEMVTALRPPKGLQGQGIGPLLFTSKLAADYNRRSPQEWTDYIRTKKQKSRKIWPELQDFFN